MVLVVWENLGKAWRYPIKYPLNANSSCIQKYYIECKKITLSFLKVFVALY